MNSGGRRGQAPRPTALPTSQASVRSEPVPFHHGLLAAVLLASGCTPAYRPRFQLDESVVRPEVAVVLITVDGMAEAVMDRMLADGRLPHIASLIEHGVRAEQAICSQPSLTYPNLATILTGAHPSRHGVMGNKWFDRYSLWHRDYTTTRTYRDADHDIQVPTVYEHLGDALTVSIQCAIRRGVTRTIDNWASSGLRWFVGSYEATDELIAHRFDLIAEEANRHGRWPVLIHAYFPGVDEVGHRCGCDSRRYRRALINVDRQIGLMIDAVAVAGMTERTCTILVADHNHTPVPPSKAFDVARRLRDHAHLRVRTGPAGGARLRDRAAAYRDIDAVVISGGDRIARIYLRGPGGWHHPPSQEQITRVLGDGPAALRAVEAVDLVAVPRTVGVSGEHRTVALHARGGRALIERRQTPAGYEYRYTVRTGDPLGVAGRGTAGTPEGGTEWLGRDAWLTVTAGGAYPGVVTQLADLFDSPRAGDIVLFAAEGWDFTAGDRGGHGGLRAIDTRVPMIFSGGMIDPSAAIERGRLVDVTPTILGLLDQQVAEPTKMFDGTDWSNRLLARERKPR